MPLIHKRPKRPRQRQKTAPTVERSSPVVDDTPDDQVDNKEFARQLSTVKEGKKFNTNKGSGESSRQKSVKQSRAAKVSGFTGDEKPSPPSSTTSVDADAGAKDDKSSAVTPEVVAAPSGGVSDMLEAAPSGPSVLRLTGTEDKTRARPAKAVEATESKKQRQNRKKAEAQKAQREVDEQERRKNMENQRRAARIAEGRSAKDGSQYTNAAANGAASAWSKTGKATGATDSTAAPSNHGLLDTFRVEPAAPVTEAVVEKASKEDMKVLANGKSWVSSMPSEEEQMEMLQSEDDGWNTVQKKAIKKPVKKDEATSCSSRSAGGVDVGQVGVDKVGRKGGAGAKGNQHLQRQAQ